MSHSTKESRFTLTLREALGVHLVEGTINLQDYKLLAEWLDCYAYIEPPARKLASGLVASIHNTEYEITTNPFEIFKLWLIVDAVFCCLTLNEQERIMRWTREYNC